MNQRLIHKSHEVDLTFISPVSGSAFLAVIVFWGLKNNFPGDSLADMLEQQAKGVSGSLSKSALFNSNGREYMSQKWLCYVPGVEVSSPRRSLCHGKP